MLCLITVASFFLLPENVMSADDIFLNEKWGLKFNVPTGVNAYTSDNPGPMASRINADTPLWLVSSSLALERINVKVSQSQDANEQELDAVKQQLERDGLPFPQYQRVSVKYITIGKEGSKKAVEHLHALKQKEPRNLRQIMFVHRGRVFNFTCATSPERYDIANKHFFDIVFRSMEFK
jgi:hypothetical protein